MATLPGKNITCSSSMGTTCSSPAWKRLVLHHHLYAQCKLASLALGLLLLAQNDDHGCMSQRACVISLNSQNALLLWQQSNMLCRYLKHRSVVVTTVRCILLAFLTCLIPASVQGSQAPPSRFIDSSGLWPLVVISLSLLVRQHVANLEGLGTTASMDTRHVQHVCMCQYKVRKLYHVVFWT